MLFGYLSCLYFQDIFTLIPHLFSSLSRLLFLFQCLLVLFFHVGFLAFVRHHFLFVFHRLYLFPVLFLQSFVYTYFPTFVFQGLPVLSTPGCFSQFVVCCHHISLVIYLFFHFCSPSLACDHFQLLSHSYVISYRHISVPSCIFPHVFKDLSVLLALLSPIRVCTFIFIYTSPLIPAKLQRLTDVSLVFLGRAKKG